MQLCFISILFAFIATVFASPLRILDNNSQAISVCSFLPCTSQTNVPHWQERGIFNIPESLDGLPQTKCFDPDLILLFWGPDSCEGKIAGGSNDLTYKMKHGFGYQHDALIKGIRRESKNQEELRFIHETVYLEEESLLLGWSKTASMYFLIIQGKGYHTGKDTGLPTKKLDALRSRARKKIVNKYGRDFVIW